MRPLLSVFWGLVVVGIDLRVEGFDVVMDAVGWLLVAHGTHRLRRTDRAFTYATVGAVVGGIGSLFQLVPAYVVGEKVAMLLGVVEAVALVVIVMAVCVAVERALAHEPTTVRHAVVLRKVFTLLTVASLAWTSVLVGVPALVVGVANLAVLVWFLVFVLMVRGRPELGERTGAEAPAV